MTSTTPISAAASASRESSRDSDGKFGAQALAEGGGTDVLTIPDTPTGMPDRLDGVRAADEVLARATVRRMTQAIERAHPDRTCKAIEVELGYDAEAPHAVSTTTIHFDDGPTSGVGGDLFDELSTLDSGIPETRIRRLRDVDTSDAERGVYRIPADHGACTGDELAQAQSRQRAAHVQAVDQARKDAMRVMVEEGMGYELELVEDDDNDDDFDRLLNGTGFDEAHWVPDRLDDAARAFRLDNRFAWGHMVTTQDTGRFILDLGVKRDSKSA